MKLLIQWVAGLLIGISITVSVAIAEPQVLGTYPELAGGINPAQLTRCIKLLKIRCARYSKDSPYPVYADRCLYKYFDRLQCRQNKALYRAIGSMVTTSARYGMIEVVNVQRYADGVSDTYLVDHSGQIIRLLNQADISGLSGSQALFAAHPDAVASDITTQKPTYILLPDGSQRLVFLQQVLLDSTIASRSDQWQVEMSYAFSAQGVYTRAKVIGLKQHH